MKKGISLIALIITIIVIIILAVITIFGVNGVIEKAREAKIAQEIATEKEWVSAATVQAKREMNSFSDETLGKALDSIAGAEKTVVFADSDKFAVQFQASERYYLVDKDGVIEGPVAPVEDEYAGDITKNGKYNGSEEKPYQINCIEDLVAVAIMSHGGNEELGLPNNGFGQKTYVELARTLDFKSIFSYNDYTTTKYGDLNNDTLKEDIRTELTKTDDGCIGFLQIKNFSGIFDGKGNAIQNLYEHVTDHGGLFMGAYINYSKVKNLEITGEIICDGNLCGGIVGENGTIDNCISRVHIQAAGDYIGGIIGCYGTLSNCQNYGIIEGNDYVGGINGEHAVISDSQNYGEIKGNNNIGGITGYSNGGVTNCKNYATVQGKVAVGGIVGHSGPTINCINRGKVIGETAVGGIRGYGGLMVNCMNYAYVEATAENGYAGGLTGNESSTNIKINSCNLGKIKGATIGGITGIFSFTQNEISKIINCYSIGELDADKEKGGIVAIKSGYGTHYIESCYWPEEFHVEAGISKAGILSIDEKTKALPLATMQSEKFVDTLNTYVETYNEEHWEDDGFVKLLNWKLDEKTRYPILEYNNE